MKKYIFLHILLATLVLLQVACTPSIDKDAKLLVSRMVDEVKDITFEYDDQNHLVVIKAIAKQDGIVGYSDSLFFDDKGAVKSRVKVFDKNLNNERYIQITDYSYINDTTVVITSLYSNALISIVDTIYINDKDQIVADKYYRYAYDQDDNGCHIIERIVHSNVEPGIVSENIKRFEYSEVYSPFSNLNLPPWFEVSGLNLFEYVGDNAPRGIIHEVLETKSGKVKRISADLEQLHIEYNAANYPTTISGEDDADGKWVVKFEYIEMK